MENCLFINLEHRKDRLESIQRQLALINVKGTRFNAVKTKDGFVGCALSHIKCLEMAKSLNYEQVFICEDDIVFRNPKLLQDNLVKFLNCNKDWDVLIIGGNNFQPYEKINDFYIKVKNCQTTTGYIVKRHYYDTLLENYKEGVKLLMKNTDQKCLYAIDIYWKKLQKKDNWYMIIPPTVTQKSSFSDIENFNVNYTQSMLSIDK